MKPFVIIAALFLTLGWISRYAYRSSVESGNTNEIYNVLAEVCLVIFVLAMIGLVIKYVFRKGVKKFNM